MCYITGNTIEFGEVDGCVEMQFNVVVEERSAKLYIHILACVVYHYSHVSVINEVVQKKPRPKRKLPETPGLPSQPPPKPTRKTSDEIPPPKPQRTRTQTSAAVLTTPHVSSKIDIYIIILSYIAS